MRGSIFRRRTKKNFKSFRDDTTLDLTAAKISEFSNHVVVIGNEKILPIAALFGANASGKSNVLEAFRYMSTYVANSLNHGGGESRKKSKSEFMSPTPFLFETTSREAESYFEVYFISSEESKEVQARVVNYFAAFDPSIIGFEVEPIENDDDMKSLQVRIDAIHRMMDTENTASIPLKLESAGTLKMFALYPLLQEVLETGGVLLVDELNARLHPLLVRTFVITFLNPETNPNHAQLVFTMHDPWLLSGNFFRRDEIWFSEKNDRGISTLYSLAEFEDEDGTKIRKDENYEKNYLLGKYGAIPMMQSFYLIEEK